MKVLSVLPDGEMEGLMPGLHVGVHRFHPDPLLLFILFSLVRKATMIIMNLFLSRIL